jgi:L-asparaginase II
MLAQRRFFKGKMMDPVLVEVLRGSMVESSHTGAVAVVDAKGSVVFSAGNIDTAIYPRSAVKALLALPLVETGAAARLGLTDAEIALACSSHSGEIIHTQAAASMLAKAGRDASCLECGTHWPMLDSAAHALAATGGHPSALHNNCSGKHSGFICLACDTGTDPKGYISPDHKTMRQVTAALAETTSTQLNDRNRATDGCSIPTYAIPLRALALAFARFGTGETFSPDRAAAAATIRAAVAANPMMVAGTGRFDVKLMTRLGDRIFSKTGAEGVYCVAIPELGLGLAIKCNDGAGRAAEIATAATLTRLLPDTTQTLAPLTHPTLTNWNGIDIGSLRPSSVF